VQQRRRFEQRAAEVLQLPQPGGGPGEPAPAAGGAVEHGQLLQQRVEALAVVAAEVVDDEADAGADRAQGLDEANHGGDVVGAGAADAVPAPAMSAGKRR
jgi:hypothetical protein